MYHIITIVPQQDQPHIKRKLKILDLSKSK